MKIENIEEVEQEAIKFLKRIREVKESATNNQVFKKGNAFKHTTASKETGALKRSSLELTRALSKMRIDTY